jgi:hypothetical protein
LIGTQLEGKKEETLVVLLQHLHKYWCSFVGITVISDSSVSGGSDSNSRSTNSGNDGVGGSSSSGTGSSSGR